jgi:hypothetical protein
MTLLSCSRTVLLLGRITAVRHARPIFVLALLFCAALPSLGTSVQLISVSEANVAFHLFPETRLEVPVFNQANRAVRATLTVEMLGNDSNAVIARHERVFKARPGSSTVTLNWPLDELPTKSVAFLSAYRLRYTLAPTQENDFQPRHGILQLGLHMVDGFGIQGYPSGEFPCAMDCRFLVRVAEPNTGRALAGYDIKAEFGPDNDQTVMHAVSDPDGYATIHYDVPSDYARPEVMMGVTVSRGPFSSGWVGEIFWRVPPHLTLTTDQHIYHSGETVRMRVVLTGVNRRRWAGGNLSLTITNVSNSQELLRKKIVTSAAGKSEAEWMVPDNIESGEFSIAVASIDEPQANWTAQDGKTIEIVPREQPAFAVSAVPDRDHYLPGQIAKLTIKAAEFGGNPIGGGKVSVKTGNDVVFSGELDRAGRLIASLDPKVIWDQIGESPSPGWPEPRSYDSPVDVTVTNAASVKTESRHVVLRLARHELHLSVDSLLRPGSERTLGIVSSYVDRSAAAADGVVEAAIPDEDGHCPAVNDASHRTVLGNFHTNAFGVARLALPKTWIHYAYPKRDDGAYSGYARVRRLDAPNEQATKDACILIRAKDRKGRTGFLTQQIAVLPETQFATRISTDHALYRPGAPIHVRIESDAGLIEAAVEIRTPGEELVGAQHVRLFNHRTEVTFPYTPRLRGLLTVQVYAVKARDDPNTADSWSTDVIYPTGERVKVGDRWGEDLWAPDVVEPDNPNIVLTPDEPEPRQIAGIRKEDLLQLDPAKPIPDGMDLAASALLGGPRSWGGWSWEYYVFRHEEFDRENLAKMETGLQKIWVQKRLHPIAEKDLVLALKEVGVDFTSLRDGWGMPYRIAFVPSGICVVSNGADKSPNTKDDYIAGRFQIGVSSPASEPLE